MDSSHEKRCDGDNSKGKQRLSGTGRQQTSCCASSGAVRPQRPNGPLVREEGGAVRAQRPYGPLLGEGGAGGHLDFHTPPEFCPDARLFSVALRPQRPYGPLGTGKPRTATSTFTQLLSSVSLDCVQVQCCFTSTVTVRTIRDGEPRTATASELCLAMPVQTWTVVKGMQG